MISVGQFRSKGVRVEATNEVQVLCIKIRVKVPRLWLGSRSKTECIGHKGKFTIAEKHVQGTIL